MSATILYRTAAVLLALFGIGHQLGFRSVPPETRVADVAQAMQSVQFGMQGAAGRTYWGFFTGFGFFVTTFLLFAAVLAWELGALGADTMRSMSRVLWAFAASFVVIAAVTWMYFFIAPGVFATLIAVCLAAAAAQAGRATSPTRRTVATYFERLARADGWQASLADRVAFTSFTSPIKTTTGKDAFLQATKRFYASIAGVEVRDVLVDGDRACVLTRYDLQPPNGGPVFKSDVAELFAVKDDRITSLGIYFDSAPFPQ